MVETQLFILSNGYCLKSHEVIERCLIHDWTS